jgi:competence protein ComEA
MMMIKRHIIIMSTCLFIVAAGACYSCSNRENTGHEIILSSEDKHDNCIMEEEVASYDAGEEELSEILIYVHLCGAIVNPGVYQVKSGTRLIDLIDEAGGLIPEAAGDYMNQAMVVEDGQRIYIPTKEELKEHNAAQYMMDGYNSITSDIRVNINTADETTLMSLPGIGKAKAKSIVEYRNKNGSFKTTEDLMKIPGIKEGLFAKIEDLVTVK